MKVKRFQSEKELRIRKDLRKMMLDDISEFLFGIFCIANILLAVHLLAAFR